MILHPRHVFQNSAERHGRLGNREIQARAVETAGLPFERRPLEIEIAEQSVELTGGRRRLGSTELVDVH